MRSTILGSCTLFHDGDFDGCMLLRASTPEGKQKRIIVTRVMLELELNAQRDKEVIDLTAPCAETYDRQEVTHESDYNLHKAGNWKEFTVQAQRVDIERLVILYRTMKIQELATRVDVPDQPLTQTLVTLDTMIGQLEHMSKAPTPVDA
jgi:hypothetical protein